MTQALENLVVHDLARKMDSLALAGWLGKMENYLLEPIPFEDICPDTCCV